MQYATYRPTFEQIAWIPAPTPEYLIMIQANGHDAVEYDAQGNPDDIVKSFEYLTDALVNIGYSHSRVNGFATNLRFVRNDDGANLATEIYAYIAAYDAVYPRVPEVMTPEMIVEYPVTDKDISKDDAVSAIMRYASYARSRVMRGYSALAQLTMVGSLAQDLYYWAYDNTSDQNALLDARYMLAAAHGAVISAQLLDSAKAEHYDREIVNTLHDLASLLRYAVSFRKSY